MRFSTPKFILVLSLLLASACIPPFFDEDGPTQNSQSDSIRNGEPIPREVYPAVGALVRKNNKTQDVWSVFCTGTLIRPDVVLSAAHCIMGLWYYGDLQNYGFTLDHDLTGKTRPDHFEGFVDYSINPDFKAGKIAGTSVSHFVGDLVLLKLRNPIDVTDLTPVLTDKDSFMLSDPVLTGVGYGNNRSLHPTFPAYDRGVGVKRKGNFSFSKTLDVEIPSSGGYVEDALIYSVALEGENAITCNGDSGGPLYGKIDGTPQIIGVLAGGIFGTNCESFTDNTHVNTSVFGDWIERTLNGFEHPWTNPKNHLDVNNDGIVTNLDALILINQLNETGPLDLSDGTLDPPPSSFYLDTTSDDFVTPRDALLVINHLNTH